MKIKILSKDGVEEVDLNRRKAIHERCLNCSGWSHKAVTNCTFDGCPLHPFRSGMGKQNAKARKKAIRKYCVWCMGGSVRKIAKCASKTCPLYAYRNSELDKSVEIGSEQKKGHIEPFFEP